VAKTCAKIEHPHPWAPLCLSQQVRQTRSP
jgi:hypothetical protein